MVETLSLNLIVLTVKLVGVQNLGILWYLNPLLILW